MSSKLHLAAALFLCSTAVAFGFSFGTRSGRGPCTANAEAAAAAERGIEPGVTEQLLATVKELKADVKATLAELAARGQAIPRAGDNALRPLDSAATAASPNAKFAVMTWQALIPRRRNEHDYVDSVKEACEADTESAACRFAMFALDLLRVSRLFNPTTSFYLLADPGALAKSPYYKGELDKLKINVKSSSDLRGPGSRAAQYDAFHYGDKSEQHPPEMLSRFCEMADLAKAEGLERILTIDADQGFFTDVVKAFQLFPEDIVTPCHQCSQIVLWSRAALDAYCEGLLSIWKLSEADRQALFTKYQTKKGFNDMNFLDMFIKEPQFAAAQKLTSAVLVWEQPSPRNPLPQLWSAAVTAMTLQPDIAHPRGEWYNMHCAHWHELVKFEQVWWSVPYVVPVLTDLQLSLPIIHFHQQCKREVVHRMFVQHYRKWYFP